MRAGILVLGPLLAKFEKAKVSLPGGCAIGARPVDIHLDFLKKNGFNNEIKKGYVISSRQNNKKNINYTFSKISVSVRSISSGSPAAGVNLPQDLSVLSSPI